MTRIEIINLLANKFGYQSYLEIGVSLGQSFEGVTIPHKVGIDPDPKSGATHITTSDHFFKDNKDKFDLIFIDGLHHKEQAYKDFTNSLECLNENGSIVFHDCLPESYEMQLVPRSQKVWTGDVYKAFCQARSENPNFFSCVVNCDYGVGIIIPNVRNENPPPKKLDLNKIEYKEWEANKQKWMNVVSPDEFKRLCTTLQIYQESIEDKIISKIESIHEISGDEIAITFREGQWGASLKELGYITLSENGIIDVIEKMENLIQKENQ